MISLFIIHAHLPSHPCSRYRDRGLCVHQHCATGGPLADCVCLVFHFLDSKQCCGSLFFQRQERRGCAFDREVVACGMVLDNFLSHFCCDHVRYHMNLLLHQIERILDKEGFGLAFITLQKVLVP